MAYNTFIIRKLVMGIVLTLCSLLTSVVAAESQYEDMLDRERLKIPQCGKSILIEFPARFSVAGDSEETERQSQLIADLQRNPARKARYAHLLMADWSSPIPSPMIAIGMLETAETTKAKLNDHSWNALKQRLLALGSETNSSISQRIAEFEKQHKGAVNPHLTRIIEVMESDQDGVVILSQTGLRHQQKQLGMVSASKLVRIDGCAVFVNMLFFQGDYQLGRKLEELVAQIRVTRG